jgi:hypothetical protein
MMFKFVKNTMLIAFLFLSINTKSFCKEIIKAQEDPFEISKNLKAQGTTPSKETPAEKDKNQTTQTPSTQKESTPQKFECSEMTLLNKLLELKPVNALRLKSAYAIAKETIKNLSVPGAKVDEKGIIEYHKKILDPINSFFGNLYDYQELLSPLVVKIFETTKYVKNKEELNKTLMIQFFFAPKEKASTYFYDALKTKEDILKVCEEFEVLFGVVNANMTDEVKKKAAELEKKAIDAKKLQVANKNQKTNLVNNQKKPEQK